MAVVTERPLVPTPLAAGEPEVRPTPVIGVITAIPATARSVSLSPGSAKCARIATKSGKVAKSTEPRPDGIHCSHQ